MASSIFAYSIGAPEGPVTLADGSMYVTEMSSSTLCVTKLDPHGQRHVVKKTGGRPNGLAIDGENAILLYCRAAALIELAQYEAAVESCERALDACQTFFKSESEKSAMQQQVITRMNTALKKLGRFEAISDSVEMATTSNMEKNNEM